MRNSLFKLIGVMFLCISVSVVQANPTNELNVNIGPNLDQLVTIRHNSKNGGYSIRINGNDITGCILYPNKNLEPGDPAFDEKGNPIYMDIKVTLRQLIEAGTQVEITTNPESVMMRILHESNALTLLPFLQTTT